MSQNTVISMKDISKQYPGVLANDKVNFDLREGEIHGLLGENGAGKSTLMKILYGMEKPTSGEVFVRGKAVSMDTPKVALAHGIGMVHQHFMLVKKFSVAINVTMGMKDKLGYRLDEKKASEVLEDFYKEMTYFKVDPKSIIEELPVGLQQRVEILKTLFRGAKILILDEPTAVLTPNETSELFAILKKFAKDGYSIIFISHKLDEIMELTDRVTVMRDGQVIGEVNTEETDKAELARMMVGRDVVFRLPKKEQHLGETVLDIHRLSVDVEWGRAVNELSFEVRKGEILGVAGVDGNGQKEMVESIVGLRDKAHGTVKLNGEDISAINPAQYNASCSYIPEDRHEEGLILEYTIADNLVLKAHVNEPFSKNGILNTNVILDNANKQIEDFRIKTPGPLVHASALSGGNQQKVVVSREMAKDPDLLIAVNPTRGIDVGSIEEIQIKLLKKRDEGKAILLVSTELEEILALSDRIAVMYEGEFMGIVPPDTPPESIGLMMAGTRHRGEDDE